MEIHFGEDLGKILHTDVLPDDCMCPNENVSAFLDTWKCKPVAKLLNTQIKEFGDVNWDAKRNKVVNLFFKAISRINFCR